MKSYGVLDASGTGRLREILEDVSNTSKRKGRDLYVGEDGAGRIIATENEADEKMFFDRCSLNTYNGDLKDLYLEACGVDGDEFFDQTDFAKYTIDEIMPRVHDLLTHGVVRYGPVRFLSDGRRQMGYAFNAARRQMTRHDRLFILGENRDREIMIAPLDWESEFVSPLACVIGKNGAWRISDIRSDRCPPKYGGCDKDPYSTWLHDMIYELYVSTSFREKSYGEFAADGFCVANFELAFEDAAKLAAFHKEPFEVLLYRGTIYVRSTRNVSFSATGSDVPPVKVMPGEFLDGGALSLDRIAAAARDAYEKFLPKYREFTAKDTSGT